MIGRRQKIRLERDVCYKEKKLDFNALLLCMLTAPTGADGFIRYGIEKEGKTYTLRYIESGFRESLKDAAEDINPSAHYLVIPSGTYYLEEYPDLSEEEILTRTLSSLLGIIGKDEIYVRLYKKNSLECVLQGIRPI